MLLAMEDIPAYLDNAALVTWFWQYSNLTGGARVLVSSLDAERAEAVLWPSRETIPVAPPPRKCVKCSEHVDSLWVTCWHCGASTDGEEDPNFFQEPTILPFPLRCSRKTFSTLVGISGPLLYLLSHGALPLLVLWFVAVVAMLVLRSWWPADKGGTEPAVDVPDLAEIGLAAEATGEAAADGYTVIEETVLQAWQSAVLSLGFLPLAFYAIWLLLRLDLREEPLAPSEQRRYLGAWAFSVVPTAMFAWWVLCLVRCGF